MRLMMAGKFRLRKAISPPIAGSRAASPDSEGKSRSPSVLVEHLYGFEGVIGEILADQRQLPENVVGHGDHMTADHICLKNIEQLAWTRPDEPGVRRRGEAAHRLGH